MGGGWLGSPPSPSLRGLHRDTPLHVTPSIKYQIKSTPIRVSIRVAQYKKRRTKQIKKQIVLNLLHGPPESVLLFFIFPPAGLLAVTYNDT